MKVPKKLAEKALNGKTAQEVYDSLDFDSLPYDSENDLSWYLSSNSISTCSDLLRLNSS